MCGIAGFCGPCSTEILKRMSDRLVHRGPDAEGFYESSADRVHLAHRRLSIIDLATGAQPMWNEDRTVCVIFNGEIYNHIPLRQELVRLGHRFASDHSDTEVLVHGWEEWGEQLPARLNGMFAFVIYDSRCRRLFAARDRFGEKPFFYSLKNGQFAFASELGALLQHPSVSREPDVVGLQKYFAYGYFPAPWTSYVNVHKLPAGSALALDIATVRIRTWRYWRFRITPDESLNSRPEPKLVEELQHHLQAAVSRRLMSDVPLGIFLSGGIDSSAVMVHAARAVPEDKLSAFTISFDEASYDESTYATLVSRHVGARHYIKRLSAMDLARQIPDILSRLDEPLSDSSFVPTYMLSGFAATQCKVALGGDGADELFAGYDPFKAIHPSRWYQRVVPGFVHQAACWAAQRLPHSSDYMSWDFRLRRALSGLSYPPSMWNPIWMAPADAEVMREIFAHPLAPADLYSEAVDLWNGSEHLGPIDRTLEFFTNLYLPDNILVKTDRASMQHSLEVRSVFLDNDLVDFCARLPTAWKYRLGRRKYLLKEALKGQLPPDILRRKKQGFALPVSSWLRTTVPMPTSFFSCREADLASTAKYWREHRSGARDHRLLLWAVLSANQALGTAA